MKIEREPKSSKISLLQEKSKLRGLQVTPGRGGLHVLLPGGSGVGFSKGTISRCFGTTLMAVFYSLLNYLYSNARPRQGVVPAKRSPADVLSETQYALFVGFRHFFR